MKKLTHAEIVDEIRLHWGLRRDIKLFLNPVGHGFVSNFVKDLPGGLFLKNPRRVNYGLCPGSCDLIGWVIFKDIAVFLAIEVKTEHDEARPDQVQFINNVNAAGGIAGVVKSAAEADRLLEDGLFRITGLMNANR